MNRDSGLHKQVLKDRVSSSSPVLGNSMAVSEPGRSAGHCGGLQSWGGVHVERQGRAGWMGRVGAVSSLGAVFLEVIDEAVGRGVVGAHITCRIQLGFNLFGQLFAQFHSVTTWKRSGSHTHMHHCTKALLNGSSVFPLSHS